jgi:hypothetical protein
MNNTVKNNSVKNNSVMNNTVKIIRFMTVAGIILVTSCRELPHVQTPTDNIPPSPLTDVKAESLPGGGKITYRVPDSDNDISYVKAEYTYRGEKRVERSSIYCDSLIIEGLGSVEPLSVNVYLVDHSQNVSTPASVSFTPDTPPIESIFNSVSLIPDFGGIKVSWTNETATEIGITFFLEDSLGIMQEIDTRFSKDVQGELVFRGYETKEYRFAVRLMDKWGNTSDSKEARLVPLFEKFLEKANFSAVVLPGDNNTTLNNRPLQNLFDESTTVLWHSDYTDQSWDYPMYATIDLGTVAKLSRFRLWGQSCCYYNNLGFRVFEVWGSNEIKPDKPDSYWKNGDWQNDWVKLNDYEVLRPSGITEPGTATGVDLTAAQNGWEFLVPLETPPCRYLRFVVHTIWSAGKGLVMAEISLWGDDNIN